MKRERIKTLSILFLIALLLLWAGSSPAFAQISSIPKFSVQMDKANSPDEVSQVFQILIILTILSIAPSIIIMTTSFTRIVIVLSFLRQAIGTQQIPPTQVLVAFALFLTFLTMMPVFQQVNKAAIQPYMSKEIKFKEALNNAEKPLRKFMIRQTREKDLELFVYASRIQKPKNIDEIPTLVIVPAFVLSELKTAFTMGFALFITFLVIDMVVASVLMSMGMFMLPPMMVSLPIKILLFVLVDGWYLVVRSILFSFR